MVVVGGALVGVAVVAYLGGSGVGFGESNLQGLTVDAALAAFAIGLASLAVAPPLRSVVARLGLTLLAAGTVAELAFSVLVAVGMADPIQYRAVFLGALLLGWALVRSDGWARIVGALLVAAMLLNGFLAVLGYNRVSLPPHTTLAALGLAVLAIVAVGGLAIAGDRVGRAPGVDPR